MELRDSLVGLCHQAGEAILDVYERADFDVESKGDDSPLTAADLASNRVLEAGLPAIKDVPIVSEEGAKEPADEYWLIDPLDGTKEFIKRNGEFTVNVALVRDGLPILGCVTVPVTGVGYFGGQGLGAWRHDGATWQPIRATQPDQTVIAVVSRSHRGDAVDALLDAIKKSGRDVEDVSFGSSLKICKVAEGTAHVYPRLGPTMPWDTAAAQAVAEGAGASVTDVEGRRLSYPAMELNPWFIVGAPGIDWTKFSE